MDKQIYIIVSKSCNNLESTDKHTVYSALGHELHISRYILFYKVIYFICKSWQTPSQALR